MVIVWPIRVLLLTSASWEAESFLCPNTCSFEHPCSPILAGAAGFSVGLVYLILPPFFEIFYCLSFSVFGCCHIFFFPPLISSLFFYYVFLCLFIYFTSCYNPSSSSSPCPTLTFFHRPLPFPTEMGRPPHGYQPTLASQVAAGLGTSSPMEAR